MRECLHEVTKSSSKCLKYGLEDVAYFKYTWPINTTCLHKFMLRGHLDALVWISFPVLSYVRTRACVLLFHA